jgi:hypothetical protein
MAELPLDWHWIRAELERLEDEIEPERMWREWRPCEKCGVHMLTWSPTQRFCSKDCRGAFERASRNYPIEEWAAAYRAGEPYHAIAKRYGVSYGCVRRNVQKAGVPPRTDYEHLLDAGAAHRRRVAQLMSEVGKRNAKRDG